MLLLDFHDNQRPSGEALHEDSLGFLAINDLMYLANVILCVKDVFDEGLEAQGPQSPLVVDVGCLVFFLD